mmetsp:Transcript_18317/g.28567  ORF Transcript_18317/g.28567 Transcript_18317/m.28567 type:complete len:557 (-) Transcript_18317:1556-3226(-)|eukprot:CAMPEP_0196826816 /NCGR_PEP_ID=MMETSP1362-20130617/93824_1 /TAXON_ID=163516 /ORGANISM="Leptocylindrus danicus, Strain CCMP1856" /LENGTH=556 /DNA_ID=CAMNT_0042207409 /DNA_START=2751 /DNA_END=4421 /DNA_ORIENTATION=-
MLEDISNNQLRCTSIVDRGANLQHRLVKLGLEIDDKAKSVVLLKESIEKLNSDNVAFLQVEKEKFDKELQDRARRNAEAHEIILNQCNNLVAEKKSLASQVEDLFEKRKQVEDETVKIVQNIRNETKVEIKNMRAQWAAEEGKRTDQWIEHKRREVREITVRGLQPQVERLLEKHRQECLELKRRFETDKSEFLELAQKKLEMDMRNSKLDATRKCDEAFSIIRSEGSINLAKARNEGIASLHSLREDLNIERENQRERQFNEFKAMAKSHAEEVQQIREAQSERIQDQERKWLEEKEALSNTLANELEELRRSWLLEREQWEGSIVQNLCTENEKKLEQARNKINEERDGEIRFLVRQAQIEAAKYEKALKLEMDEELSNLKVSHLQKMKESYEKLNHWEKKCTECTHAICQLEKDRVKCEEENQTLETWLEGASEDIAELKHKQEISEQNASRKENEIALESKQKTAELERRQKEVEIEVAAVEEFLAEEKRKHHSKLKELEIRKIKNLTALEDSVKTEMATKDSILDEVREKLADMEVRLQHTLEIIKKYASC